jgi:hypothetical protein
MRRPFQSSSIGTTLPWLESTFLPRSLRLGVNAGWISFKATVSTAPDQIAVAPGYLVREYQENGRRVFEYEANEPMHALFAFLSARYEVWRDEWNGIKLEIYYHKSHEYNLDRMMASMKASLESFSTHFSPYQFKQVRILEFPRYAGFAQAFPNTVPCSESIGFILRGGTTSTCPTTSRPMRSGTSGGPTKSSGPTSKGRPCFRKDWPITPPSR